MAKRLFNERNQFFDNSGNPLPGGQLFFYVAQSVGTRQNTYSDSAGTIPNTNPIVLDAFGRPTVEIWLTSGASYKVILANSGDGGPVIDPVSPIWTEDNITGINDVTATVSEWSPGPVGTFVSATSFTLVGDQTSTFTIGRAVKIVDAGGTKYGFIKTSVFTTLTTVTLDQNSNALASPVSSVAYGILDPAHTSEPILSETIPLRHAAADESSQARLALSGIPTATTVSLNVGPAGVVEGVSGTAIASAATINLDTANGDYESVTGTTPTTAITLSAGRERTVVAAGAWPITAGAALVMTGVVASGATYTCQAGDVFTFRGEAGLVRLVGFEPTSSTAAGSSLVLLSTKTAANSASLSFTPTDFSWTAYDEYEFHFISCVPGTSGAIMQAQISENAGSSYISSANYSQNNEVVTGTTITVTTGSGQTSLTVTGAQSNNAALNLFNGKLIFYRPWETGHNKTIEVVNGSYVNSAGAALERKRMVGAYSGDTNAINGIQFAESTGNYSGTIAVYGIKKS